jgi:hypothetical protein
MQDDVKRAAWPSWFASAVAAGDAPSGSNGRKVHCWRCGSQVSVFRTEVTKNTAHLSRPWPRRGHGRRALRQFQAYYPGAKDADTSPERQRRDSGGRGPVAGAPGLCFFRAGVTSRPAPTRAAARYPPRRPAPTAAQQPEPWRRRSRAAPHGRCPGRGPALLPGPVHRNPG